MTADWTAELERLAPAIVGAWRGIEAGRVLSVRREIRRRGGHGSTSALVAELAGTAAALAAVVEALPDEAFSQPGGEADWTVAEAIGHDAAARAGLALAASLAAGRRWPADAPRVVPGVPGPATQARSDLLQKIAQSQRIIARSARAISGHETDPCPLEHPLVGRLRCGEWLLFAGVHDVMHLEQLHAIAARFGPVATDSAPSPSDRVG
jgi:hypothetical protein